MFKTALNKLRPAPAVPPITDAAEIDATYRHWRARILGTSFLGYAVYYFGRVNISMAIPQMQADLGYSKAQLGLVVSALQVAYGIGKFANGVLADRANPRYFMALGLLLSGLMNVCFGLSASLALLVVLWAVNGWCQSMGFPSGARLLSHWYSPTEYGWIWGIYGCSHQVGTAVVLVVVGYLVPLGWSWAFFVPGIIAAGISFVLAHRLRDVPASMGLPPVEVFKKEQPSTPSGRANADASAGAPTLLRLVASSRALWCVAFGNMFLYVARYGALTWAPTFIKETKGYQLSTAGWMMALFEGMGIAGMLSAGWLSDRVFHTRRGPVMAIYMAGATAALVMFWLAPADRPFVFVSAFGASGFFIYGPLMLVSVAAAGFAGRNAAASAAGFTGFWGYVGAVASGFGIGWVAQEFGWSVSFFVLALSGILSAACFALTWNVAARGAPKPASA